MESKFAVAMQSFLSKVTTWNGAPTLSSPDVNDSAPCKGRLSLLFHGVRGLDKVTLHNYLEMSAKESLIDTVILIFNLRDCRGGKGERALGRESLLWLQDNHPSTFQKVFTLLPEYGRWDDITYLYDNGGKSKDLLKFYGNQLIDDRKNMMDGKSCSLAPKWSPTEKPKLKKLFASLATTMGISPKQLRTEYNTPLRSYLKVVEKYMCTGKWNEIDYNKVPSCAMNKLKKAFERHDPERYGQWREALKLGDKKIAKVNAKQLYPHELIEQIIDGSRDTLISAQWNVLLEETKKKGKLSDALVIADTSGSMFGLPITVAIGLGIMIADMNEGVFHNHIINFDASPTFTVLGDYDIFSKVHTLQRMPWGGNTDLNKVFNLILNKARDHKLSQEDMPKKLFILSDMQFDNATGNSSKTSFELIDEMYKNSGYIRPQIIFWNLSGKIKDFPVTAREDGTLLVSGFNTEILKNILDLGTFTPECLLNNLVNSERYQPVRKLLTK